MLSVTYYFHCYFLTEKSSIIHPAAKETALKLKSSLYLLSAGEDDIAYHHDIWSVFIFNYYLPTTIFHRSNALYFTCTSGNLSFFKFPIHYIPFTLSQFSHYLLLLSGMFFYSSYLRNFFFKVRSHSNLGIALLRKSLQIIPPQANPYILYLTSVKCICAYFCIYHQDTKTVISASPTKLWVPERTSHFFLCNKTRFMDGINKKIQRKIWFTW